MCHGSVNNILKLNYIHIKLNMHMNLIKITAREARSLVKIIVQSNEATVFINSLNMQNCYYWARANPN